jgi:mannose-P-dolichol utilization defect 1
MIRALALGALALALLAGVAAASAPASGGPAFRLLVVREDCWPVFFERFDLLNVECLKASISKALG